MSETFDRRELEEWTHLFKGLDEKFAIQEGGGSVARGL